MTHGHDLPPDERRLLRSPPPAPALRWCERAVGRGARTVAVAALEGGTSSAVHAVDVADARGRVHALVLRRFVRREWLEEEPGAPRREAAALTVARGCEAIATPELVALDADAAVPTLLMTRLDGATVWRPDDAEPYLRRLAAVLPAIHATPVPASTGIPPYDPYERYVDGPPSWSRRPRVWERALELFSGPAPETGERFVHRDYHPGNVLWRDGAVSGVVDWACASIGAPAADVGYCRWNLAAELGLEAADRFAALYRAIAGADEHHPYWDVVAAIGGLDEDDWTERDEDFLAAAVARLHG